MFKDTYKMKIVRDAAGLPTGVSNVEKLSIGSGVIAGLSSVASEDVAVIGIGRTLATIGLTYAAAVGTNYLLTGGFHVNPASVK